jgi:hypothetical protein
MKSDSLLLVSVEYDRCSRRTTSHGLQTRATADAHGITRDYGRAAHGTAARRFLFARRPTLRLCGFYDARDGGFDFFAGQRAFAGAEEQRKRYAFLAFL